MRLVYAVFAFLGAVLLLSAVVPWLIRHGMAPRLFLHELFVNRVNAFFALDVIVSALVVLCFVYMETRSHSITTALDPGLGDVASRGLVWTSATAFDAREPQRQSVSYCQNRYDSRR